MNKSVKQRFLDKILITDDCWEWIAGKYHDGYGIFRIENKSYRAHRVSYELFIGDIPDGMLVCHRCDNPACVKPSHLFIGTIQDNVNDRQNKGHSTGGKLKGEDCPAHKYTKKDVIEIRSLYNTGQYSQRDLARKFNISRPTIKNMVNRDTWKHI